VAEPKNQSGFPDPVLSTLLLPFATGQLTWPAVGGALFLRARSGTMLRGIARSGLLCEQSYKPAVDALTRDGWSLRTKDAEPARHSLVLVLPPRQRQEARALLAHAVDHCAPGGTVVACMANDEGARSGESDLKSLAGLAGNLSKNHCRVYWSTVNAATCDADLLSTWRTLDAPRQILDGRFISRPGVFAWERIDPASALLAAHLPATLAGRAADLGCGFGYLATELLQRCPGINALDLYEAEGRALDLARQNLAPYSDRVSLDFQWHDVTCGVPGRYDVIVSNPPFHAEGAGDRPDIGRAFIAAAAEALRPGGRLWMVANRHLPYESVLDARFGTVRTVTQVGGFKIIEAVKAGGARS
jgi:16S rRNA (guanine1207-N2)-methyltransferase